MKTQDAARNRRRGVTSPLSSSQLRQHAAGGVA